MEELHNDELHLILLALLYQGWGGRVMYHAWRRGDVFSGFRLGGPKGRNPGTGERITLRWTLVIQASMGWTGFDWLRTQSNGKLLWIW